MHVLVCICSKVWHFFHIPFRIQRTVICTTGEHSQGSCITQLCFAGQNLLPTYSYTQGKVLRFHTKGAFSHSAGTATIITLFIPGAPLRTTHLQERA